MASTEEKSGPDKNDGIAVLVIFGIVVAAATLIPALLASALYFLLRGRLKRIESSILGGIGLIGLLINPKQTFSSYFHWLMVLATGDGNRLDIPWYPLAMFSLFLAGLALFARGTRFVAWLPTTISKFRKTSLETESILPTAREKQRVSVVAPTQAPLVVDSSSHSILDPAKKQGKRSFPIGHDKNGSPVLLSEDEIRMHGLIFGSTGSGKSETIKSIAGGLLDLGWDGMVLDLKEDTAHEGLRDWCDKYARAHALPYQELCLSDPNPTFWFNPLMGMGLDEARDTILSMQKFETPYYEALNKQQLGELLTLLFAASEVDPIQFPTPTFTDIGRILAAPSLPSAIKKYLATVVMHTNYTKDDFPSLSGTDKNFVDTAKGLGARIGAEFTTRAGRVLLSPPPADVNRPLMDVTLPGVTYVGLDSTGKVNLSRVISTAVLKRMSVYASDRISGKIRAVPGEKHKPRFLIVDEANFIDRKTTMALLSRARSSGIAMILCTQGPLDWRAAPGEPGVEELIQNTNVTIIMSQGDRAAAEICADIIGRQSTYAISQRMQEGEIVEGSGSLRSVVDYMVSPDNLRSLQIGEAVMRVGKPTERVVWTKIAMRDPKLVASRVSPQRRLGG